MEAFIGGLPRSIEGNVTASKPQNLEEAINIAQRLMDQVTKHAPMQVSSDNKRKFDDRRTLMNRVCKPYLDKFVIVFIDDILIYSRNKEEHANHLRVILELLRKEKLYVKLSKCDFWIHIVQFLGHLIDSQGLHVDPTKIEAIKNWTSPTKLTQKNKSYIWGEEQESAVQLLKQKLCKAPILALPEENDNFVVYCDASLQGLGA
ncbi:putative reverse transcriptase domain-containing protein, partial [Tanacetum coccineum]